LEDRTRFSVVTLPVDWMILSPMDERELICAAGPEAVIRLDRLDFR
jgi:hypothetical protein